MKIGFLGIPFDGDGTRPEMDNPTQALREAGMLALHQSGGDELLDYGDIDMPVVKPSYRERNECGQH